MCGNTKIPWSDQSPQGTLFLTVLMRFHPETRTLIRLQYP